MSPFLWEQHCCLPLTPDAEVAELARYPLGSYLSVNVGYSRQRTTDTLELLHAFRAAAVADGRFRLVETLADVGAPGAIALAFDLEDAGPLGGDLDTVRVFHELGVRSLLPTYNHANAAGCGCLDTEDTGLDLAEHTDVPMIYSHANFAALWEHPRNITDDQARACAATGGVIGINGVGIFLGRNRPEQAAERVEAMADHIQYGAELVGIEHIGIGSDYSFDAADFNAELTENPGAFSDAYTAWGPLQWTAPEELLGLDSVPGLDQVLAARGFTPADLAAVFGGNFCRAAAKVWR
ncbi:membrane dipeptidase [Nocardia farcinica]|uniref:Membrane dipeptidase (Peptidase family M19) n=1 Tax=Nocardia farcinica TaxID=37329 RepID=A0A0H5P3C5_NOCFR|nr:membrane dipeptidase [Nocardia farcinica]AXK87480.1 membrane dipeptidase [Nocardia farcinica]CRY81809.1 Membrane dipeptidase (Peptidase family M19) [Nocardia farcinica]SIT30559.1 membrane dipeptidase [Nocardia farcinica]